MWTSLHSRTMQDSAVKPCSVKCGMGGAEGCHNTGELTHLGERDSYPYKRGLDRKVGAPSCDKVPLLSQHPFVANFLPFPTNWHPLSHLSEYNLVQLCGEVRYSFLIIFNSGDPKTYAGGGGLILFLVILSNVISSNFEFWWSWNIWWRWWSWWTHNTSCPIFSFDIFNIFNSIN